MEKRYNGKISKFNHYYCDDEKMILYNSYLGLKSILRVENTKIIKAIKRYLNDEEQNVDEELLDILRRKGYIIDEEVDERKQVAKERNIAINDNKVVITIIPTTACNFKCIYCYEAFKVKKMDEVTQENLIKFVDFVTEKKKSIFVNWFGGEPLLAVDIIVKLTNAFVTICRKKKISYLAGITTNGYLLNKDVIKKLLRCFVVDYQVTIDGLKEEHNKYRILKNDEGTYEQIMENLIDISRNVKSEMFNISIRCNFTKKSSKKYDQIANKFNELFGDDKRFSFSVHAVKDWGGLGVSKIGQELMNDKEEEKLIKDAFINRKKMDFASHLSVLDKQSNACYTVGKNNYVINADGGIFKCTTDFENELGNINDIKSAVDFHNIKSWVDYKNVDEDCNDCFFYGACRRLICPKALKMGFKMCPIEKKCIDELLLSIDIDLFKKNDKLDVYEYMKE